MSSTGRGKPRHLNDFYETPLWLTEAIMPVILDRIGMASYPRILEPACGDGAITRVLEKHFLSSEIVSCDMAGGGSVGRPVNFLTDPIEDLQQGYDLIITNPPYKHAQEFVDRAFDARIAVGPAPYRPFPVVAMLLRLNFLGSQKRAVWWRDRQPQVYVTPKRPSFTEDGKTDSTEYAWFLWQFPFTCNTGIHHLDTENIKAEKSKIMLDKAKARAERQTPDVGLTID